MTYKHITKEDFYNLIEKRLKEYQVAIPNKDLQSRLSLGMILAREYGIKVLKSINLTDNIINSDFWGYGINNVCDGNESVSHFDVEEIKKRGELNKHSRDYRKLLLLTFKVDDDALYVSLFCIDTCSQSVNSTINTRYDLRKFNNARIKIRNEKIFVDFIFDQLEKPISFQIETYTTPNAGSSKQKANYYIDTLKELANEVKNRNNNGEQIYSAGQQFDALLKFNEIISKAKKEIILVDNYIDEKILELLAKKNRNVNCRVLTKNVNSTLKTFIDAFNKQHNNLEVRTSSFFHDRYVVIDQMDFHHFGASIKDAGNKGFMYNKIEKKTEKEKLLQQIETQWAK